MAATFNGKFGELSKRLIGIVIALLFQLPIFATFFSRTLLPEGHSHGNSRMAFRQRCLAALALTMESAHVLELRQKMQYGERSRNIYQTRVYGRIHLRGGVYQVVSIIATGVLAFMVRKANDLYFDLDWLFLSIAGVWCLACCSRAGKFGRSRCASFGARISADALATPAQPVGVWPRGGLRVAACRILRACAVSSDGNPKGLGG